MFLYKENLMVPLKNESVFFLEKTSLTFEYNFCTPLPQKKFCSGKEWILYFHLCSGKNNHFIIPEKCFF